jgi:hypothetical protein
MTLTQAKKLYRIELDQQHGAILAALDKLYEYEVAACASRPVLRLVSPGDAIDRDSASEGLRVSLVRHGWDLWAFGGELGLFDALRYVMARQPHRQKWNRTVLSTLWADIGMPERNSA